jgi:hypothetical protein
MSPQGHSLPIGHALTSHDVRNCSKAELSWSRRKFPTERIDKAAPTRRRHELRDAGGSLRADSPRIEATFLPDHPAKNSTGRAFSAADCSRAWQTSSAVGPSVDPPRGSLAVEASLSGAAGVAPACALAGAAEARQTQAIVRLCEALWCRFCSTTAKRAEWRTGATIKNLNKT